MQSKSENKSGLFCTLELCESSKAICCLMKLCKRKIMKKKDKILFSFTIWLLKGNLIIFLAYTMVLVSWLSQGQQ